MNPRNAKRIWMHFFTLLLFLVACTTPSQLPQESNQVKVSSTFVPTLPPTHTPTIIVASDEITQTASENAASNAKPENACSQASLGESSLLSNWDRKLALHTLIPINPISGQPLCAYAPLPIGRNYFYAFSPDGKDLAVVASQREDGRDGVLQLIDLQNWQATSTSIKFDYWVNAMDFSPDEHALAVVSAAPPTGKHGLPDGYRLAVIDVANQSIQAETSLSFVPRLVRFTTDGASLVVYGGTVTEGDLANADPHLLLLDSATLATDWEIRLEGLTDGQFWQGESDNPDAFTFWSPAIVFSPEKEAIYIVHADANRLTTVDLALRTTGTVQIQPATSWIERLLALTAGVAQAKGLNGGIKSAVLSADGSRLYVVGESGVTSQDSNGEWQFSNEVLGLQVIDAASGMEIARLETECTDLALSSDGNVLFLHGWSNIAWTDVVDAHSLEIVAHLAGRYLISGRLLNGEAILLSSAQNESSLTSLASLDPASLKEITAWGVRDFASWIVAP